MNRRIIAATELVPIFPAALFLTAVVARHLPQLQYEPAHIAQEIVTWYSVRYWTLWVLLIGLPLAALFNGCVVLLRNADAETNEGQIAKQPFAAIDAQLPTQINAVATLAAALILVVVVLHQLAN
jgi:hypothetical protein